jgi:LmbE family N-acetylglucosaminyl deacetylase
MPHERERVLSGTNRSAEEMSDASHLLLLAEPPPAVLVVVAHPDDEAIGLGAQLARLRERVVVAHLTDGSPHDPSDARAAGFATREAYARARRAELEAALAEAGIGPERTRGLSLVDQDASLHLAAAARFVARLVEEERPQVVVVPAYEGGHPDHDAAAFAAHAAVSLASRPAPAIVEFPLYRTGPEGMTIARFLPGGPPAVEVPLDERRQELKRRMVARFATQQRVLAAFPLDREVFRDAPSYDFGRPPHAGRLHYESQAWGLTGERWRELAVAAERELGLTPVATP